jgi:hypothetical protein
MHHCHEDLPHIKQGGLRFIVLRISLSIGTSGLDSIDMQYNIWKARRRAEYSSVSVDFEKVRRGRTSNLDIAVLILQK